MKTFKKTYLDLLPLDNIINIFNYINTTKLKINDNMTTIDIIDLIWEVQKIEQKQNLYFMELKCSQILMELKLKKKIVDYKIYWPTIIYEDDLYEYMYCI